MPHNRCVPFDRVISVVRVVAALVAMVATMLLVAALGVWVLIPSGWVRSVDEGGVARGTGVFTDHPWLVDPAHWWAMLSGPWFVHPLVLVLGLLLAARRRITVRTALITFSIGVVGWALGAVCKEIVERPRPDGALVTLGSWSYPSGHATNIALGAVLVMSLVRAVRTVWIRWSATMLALLGTALTAADRVLLGVHYISDVVAGLTLGSLVAVIALACLPARRRPDSHPGSASDG